MAARRLLVVMVMLLIISSIAAALVPVQPRDPREPPTPRSERRAAPAPQGKLVRASLRAGKRPPPRVRARVGDQLRLRVSGRPSGTVILTGIGATANLDPVVPARFDVLLREPGTFPVRLLQSGRTLGLIEVRAARPRPSARPGEKAAPVPPDGGSAATAA